MAADRLKKLYPLLMTAAGTIKPARVVILGAGVAGLQAIATAKRLGAIVEVNDIRPAVKEQVESLGGRFIDMPTAEDAEDKGGYAKEMGEDFLAKQREVLTNHIRQADVVITTALIPGKPAPRLVTEDMVKAMKPGSVLIDLAAVMGGNCELTEPGASVTKHDVLIVGEKNVPGLVPFHSSEMYARNVLEVFKLNVKDGAVAIDLADEINAGSIPIQGAAPIVTKEEEKPPKPEESAEKSEEAPAESPEKEGE
jgi:NAD(P) transhydrogenase subunit alpha